jgi:hypothetical protein
MHASKTKVSSPSAHKHNSLTLRWWRAQGLDLNQRQSDLDYSSTISFPQTNRVHDNATTTREQPLLCTYIRYGKFIKHRHTTRHAFEPDVGRVGHFMLSQLIEPIYNNIFCALIESGGYCSHVIVK